MITPFVDGLTLRERLRARPMATAEAIHVPGPVAAALAAINGKGVIHRDIKSSTVLIEAETDTVYLADFGIAKRADNPIRSTVGDSFAGSPAYASPEQFLGDGVLAQASDLYSFGVVAFEVLTGELPFSSASPIGFAAKHVGEEMRSVADLGPSTPAWS